MDYRKSLELSSQDCLPATRLASFLNVRLIEPADIGQLPEKKLEHLLTTREWSGLTFKVADQPVIIYKPTQSIRRFESTIMHELSHIILGHEPTENYDNFPNLPLRDYNPKHEKEANWLGGCLQMPLKGLLNFLYKGASVDEIAQNFGASTQMTEFRINASGAKRIVENSKKKKR